MARLRRAALPAGVALGAVVVLVGAGYGVYRVVDAHISRTVTVDGHQITAPPGWTVSSGGFQLITSPDGSVTVSISDLTCALGNSGQTSSPSDLGIARAGWTVNWECNEFSIAPRGTWNTDAIWIDGPIGRLHAYHDDLQSLLDSAH